MKNYNEETIVFAPREHVIYLKKGTIHPCYVPVHTLKEKLIDNPNIIIPCIMLSAHMHLDNSNYELYINTEEVVALKSCLRQNMPGIPKEHFQNIKQEEIIMAPHTHEIRLPYREGKLDLDPDSPTFGQLQETVHEYQDYEAVSPESEYEYPFGRSLWSDNDEPYITYKLYQNTNTVAIMLKDLDKNIPGKRFVKSLTKNI